jgi:hypothetical protein
MIDIFADIKPQPKLYIADVHIVGTYKARANSKKEELISVNLDRSPIVLVDGKVPTKRYETAFLKRVYNEHIKKGDFERMNLRIKSIDNPFFSSNLAYNFDYDKH